MTPAAATPPGAPAGQVLPEAAAGTGGAVALYDVDPDTVAALVLACPAVAGLSGGPFGAAATYLPGRRVAGVRIVPDTVEVHVVARYGPTIRELAGQVRAALSGRTLGRAVDIVVEDLADPAPTTPVPPGAPPLAGEVVDPQLLLTGEVPGTAPVPPGPSAVRPGRWPQAGRHS